MEPTRTDTDVLVIGGGGSGLAAAIEAATLGRRVVVVEKNDHFGGSTIRSIGSISASGTPHQVRLGIQDSPDDHFEDIGAFIEKSSRTHMKGWNNQDNPALRRILVDNVNDTVRWLMSIGVCFFGPTPEAPHRRPRMHNVLPNSRAYGYFLERRARKLKVDLRTGRRASRLLLNGQRVEGVECQRADGTTEQYFARGGIVLTCGDYSASPELKRRFAGEKVANVQPACNPANTGDGHIMAMELGASVINGHLAVPIIRFVAPPRRRLVELLPPWRALTKFMEISLDYMPNWLLRPFIMSFLTTYLASSPELFVKGAILVNRKGERFCDELDKPVYRLAEQPDQIAYIVFDERIAKLFSQYPHYISTAPGIAYAYLPDYRRSRRDVFHTAPTVPGLAKRIGVDSKILEKTIADYNDSLPEAEASKRLRAGPYYALGPVSCFLRGTDGGLAINDSFQVLGREGEPIEGLFAAGLAGEGGVLLEGHGHHLGWAFTSGRFAGRNAAHLATSPSTVE